MGLHSTRSNTTAMHGAVKYTVANAAALAAATPTATELADKSIWLQTDTRQLWVPKSTTTGDFEPLVLPATASPAALGVAAVGTATKFAREDHVHVMPRLDQVSAPTASVAMNSQKFTGMAQGVSGGESMRIDDNSLQYQVEVKEDWDNGGITGTRAWVSVVGGTGTTTAVTTSTSDKNVGIVQLARGATAVSRAGIFLGATVATWTIGTNGNTRELWLFQVPNLSDGTNTFRCVLGRGDTSAAGDQVNGVYIVVDTTVTTKIQLCSAASSTRTLVAGTFDVAGATWVLAAIKKSDGSTTHGLEVWTGGAWVDQGISISTNIPTATLDLVAKLDGSVGTTSRTLLVDFVHHRTSYPSGRA